MLTLHLRIITPKKIVFDEAVNSVNVPTIDGEITILPHHVNLFSLLTEGIIKINKGDSESFLAIGGGYLETDGNDLNILVAKAYNQDEIDDKLTEKAIEQSKKILSESKNKQERFEAAALLRRSTINLKLIKKRKKSPLHQ